MRKSHYLSLCGMDTDLFSVLLHWQFVSYLYQSINGIVKMLSL